MNMYKLFFGIKLLYKSFASLFLIWAILISMFGAIVTSAEQISIAQSGTPQMTIYIPDTASEELQTSANELATTLNQITGGTFTISTFNSSTGPLPGIILGKSTDLNLTSEVPEPGSNMKIRERYILSTANSGDYIFLAGATDLAIQDAVYDFLERLECRWFFASPNWTIIPSDANLSWQTPALLRSLNVTMGSQNISMNIYVDELPDYKMRNIWAEYCGSSGDNGDWYQQELDWGYWRKQNRVANSYYISAGHNYSGIVQWAITNNCWSNDYYALIDGVRNSSGQLCLGNPAVQQLLRDYAVAKLVGTVESVSLEPNDNTRWCQCALCEAIQPLSSGFVTDRVITANNFAASYIPAGKYIGMYAYSMHSDAPSINVDDQIYVLIATAFLSYGNTDESLVSEWSAKAQNLGIRDYFSVWDWDHNLPGSGRASNLSFISSKLPYYNNNNVDVMSAESTHSWGSLGLGYYIAGKLLWDTSQDVETLKTDFLNRCFGPAAATMRDFYEHLDGANYYPLSDDLLGRLYGYLMTARGETADANIVARLDDLTLYLRYVDLYQEYGSDSEEVLRFTYKIKDTNMVDSLTCWRNYTGTWPDDKNWQVTYPDHPWKDATPYTHAEIVQMNQDGVTNNPTLPEEPHLFSDDLVLSGAAAGTTGGFNRTRGAVYIFLRADSNGVLPSLDIANGFSYTNKGDAVWTLYTADGETELESGTIPPDQLYHTVTFSTSGTGNYLFYYNDARATSQILWSVDSTVNMCAYSGRTLWLAARASRMYFYVPKGTQYVEATASYMSDCDFYNGDGILKQAYTIGQYNVDVIIPVNESEDDSIWYVTDLKTTNFQFRNIPGQLAKSQDKLLIPREAYSNLVPSGYTASTRGGTGPIRGVIRFYLHTKPDGSLPDLNILDGRIYTNRGDLTWTLYNEDESVQLETGSVPPDVQSHTVSFTDPAVPGTYLLKTDDNMAGYSVTWDSGEYVSVATDEESTFYNTSRAGRLYFYVPKGTTEISFAATTSCSDCDFYDGNGSFVYTFPGGTSGSVTVPAGQDGQVWYFKDVKTTGFYFTNIPGIMALNKDELLVPHWALTE